MPQWGKTDDANNIVTWAAQTLSLGSGSSNKAANNTALYGNTTANSFVNGMAVGLFGVTDDEAQATPGIKAPGWVLVRTGTGGRAGRTSYETLVAVSSMSSDSDSTTIPNAVLSFTINPSDATANSSNNDVATFTASAVAIPSGTSISYVWQANTGTGFANVADGNVYSNSTTTTLSVTNTTGLDGTTFRLGAYATGANSVFSNSATLTVTT